MLFIKLSGILITENFYVYILDRKIERVIFEKTYKRGRIKKGTHLDINVRIFFNFFLVFSSLIRTSAL